MTNVKSRILSRREFLINSLIGIGLTYSSYSFSSSRLKVLLKLDDLVLRPKIGLSENWRAVIEFLHKNDVAASFGVIGNNLTGGKVDFSDQLIEIAKENLFELWNHGYSKAKRGDIFIDSEEEQYNRLNRIQMTLKEITGTAPRFFGPHAGNKNNETFSALSRIADIKGIWFYEPPKEFQSRFIVIPRNVEAEKPIFYPNSELIFKTINSEKTNALQFHPDQWDEDRFKTFCNIVLALKNEGVSFILPSSLL